ncbi:MAG: adenosylcobinamide-GDP ribazoletransferase [Candidatus Eremiobacteraeota bacterium]|nr:adenosylcobinamide-GDP ribazoletransferase [Candidatus Eremiobacteraeota bacterium]
MSVLRAIAAAFSYFSIFPVRSFASAPNGAAIGWLPLVGVVIGGAAGVLAAFVFSYGHEIAWVIVVAVVVSVVLSGAIHIDGYLDCCDALLMTTTPARRLEVLRDPRHGSYALVGMMLLTIVWLAALAGIAPAQYPASLLFAAVTARASIVSLAGQYPHARNDSRFEACRWYGAIWFVVLLGLAFALTRAWQSLVVVIAAFLFAQVLALVFSRRLGGGLTGDTYGAIITVTEVALLIALPWSGVLPK